jgi:flagellar hook-basal body complex protein FliE
MSIDPISMGAVVLPDVRAEGMHHVSTAPNFTDWLNQQIASTNDLIVRADDGVRKLALGETENLHQVMIDLEKAKLSFELIVQMRNKLLDSYQDLMRMSI